MRLTTKKNPLGLQIGERVNARQTVTVEYDEEDNKRLLPFDFDATCLVTGVVRKALGKYEKASHYRSLDGDEYEPAYLKVSEYVTLYECKVNITDKPFLVHPDDIEVLE